jgi:hypothetical protein
MPDLQNVSAGDVKQQVTKSVGDLGDKDKARLGTLQQTVTQGKLGSAVTGGLIGLAGSAAQLINVLSKHIFTT